MSSTASVNIFGLSHRVHSVDGFESFREWDGSAASMAIVTINNHGRLLSGIRIPTDSITVVSREPMPPAAIERAARYFECPICVNMFPFLCDTHRAERNA